MSLRIGAQTLATSPALRRTNDERVPDMKPRADLGQGPHPDRAIDDAAGLAASDKMGDLLQALQRSLADASAGLTPPETATTDAPVPAERLQNLEELASAALRDFVSQTRTLPPDAARESARRTAEQIQTRPEQAVLGQATMIPSSVLNLLH